MAEKKKNSKNQKASGQKKKVWIVVAAAILVLAAAVAAILLLPGNKTEHPTEKPAGNPQVTVNQPIEIHPENQNMGNPMKPEEVRKNDIAGFTDQDILPLGDLGEGLTITRAGCYTGKFVEDGKNLPTENVLAILVTNNSDKFVEFAEITAASGTQTALFRLTSLPAGQSALVMENRGFCYEEGMTFGKTDLRSITKPDKEFSLYPETFQIKAADGVVNLVNQTETDYPGKIAIYFKNAQDGIYIGGITYKRTLENGIPAKGIAQFMADNYTVAGSELVFIEYEH